MMKTQPTNLAAAPNNWREALAERFRQGNLGSLPVIIGLIIIAIVFQSINKNFLTPLNLTNLMVQIAAMGTISTGVVLILLLGEVDLSAGQVSGLAAAVMAVFVSRHNLPAGVAIVGAIVVGALVGLLQGWWISSFRVPSFVVTLAGLLAWQGARLRVLGDTGSINITNKFIIDIANFRLPIWLGWVFGVIGVVVYALIVFNEYRSRRAAELPVGSLNGVLWRVGVVGASVLAGVAMMSVNRNANAAGIPIQGVPTAVIIFMTFLIIFDFITQRTRFGRYVYAVGGNTEAARRAGINVNRIRITIFMLASALAACGGILAASRLNAANQSSGDGDVLLNAIAAAVIGGTSLFGGRGRIWSALLGALVIGAIANGMDLLALKSSIKFIVTGAVLLLAVTIDAASRARRENSGR
ncbi:sugar ABC transporter permease [Herpetosiphon llansteffanensis]|uniref:sugar ABC transporter permease n=1 Tax=Herpetosiphon llansteffanensis TaxID=2094568 RepID=UPI000D7C5E3D|nr:sugar ABC transporter permease [Herpetosiphon llansteffanensis]